MRKPTIWVSNQVGHRNRCKIEALDFLFKKKRDCTICVAKTKASTSFAVTEKLVCAFLSAYADCWFSDAAAQIQKVSLEIITLQNNKVVRLF